MPFDFFKFCALVLDICCVWFKFREARLEILKLHVTQDAKLNEQDWDTLAENTAGFSGSDIATCTADAVLEPVRELETCKYWKLTKGNNVLMGWVI